MWVHRVTGFCMVLLTFIFALKMIAAFDWEIDTSDPHYIIGSIILSIVGVVMLLGVFSRSRLTRNKWNT
jgi:putative Mn2+ efflux pump MntP